MKQYHPVCNFIYFTTVIGFTMFLNHPVFLCISLAGALGYILQLFGVKRSGKSLTGLFFLMLVTALMNPAFSHQGITVIAILPTGNVLTLESILYGLGIACKLGAVLLWFYSLSEVFTADKIVYLFGKTFPVMGLMLSMIIGFIPKMQNKLRDITMSRGKARNVKQGMDKLSTLITWALEDVAEQADSMKGRGYGLEGRTVFNAFPFMESDKRMCMLLTGMILLMAAASFKGYTKWYYYPELSQIKINGRSILYYAGYAFLCFLPVLKGKYEEIKWSRLQSEI